MHPPTQYTAELQNKVEYSNVLELPVGKQQGLSVLYILQTIYLALPTQ